MLTDFFFSIPPTDPISENAFDAKRKKGGDSLRVELLSSVLLLTLGKVRSLQGTELSATVVICLLRLF